MSYLADRLCLIASLLSQLRRLEGRSTSRDKETFVGPLAPLRVSALYFGRRKVCASIYLERGGVCLPA